MRKGTEFLLKGAIALCVMFSLANLAGYVFSHVPPYKVGQCLGAKANPLLSIQIKENFILGGYSTVEVEMLGQTQEGPITFTDLRNPALEPADCPK